MVPAISTDRSRRITEAMEVARHRLVHDHPGVGFSMIDDAVGDAVLQWLDRYEALGAGLVSEFLPQLAEWRLTDALRRESHWSPLTTAVSEQVVSREAFPERRVEEAEVARRLEQVPLTKRSRLVVEMRVAGWGFAAIAIRIGITVANARQKFLRSIQRLRDSLR